MRLPALALAAAAALVAGCRPRTPPPDLSLDPAGLLAQVRAAQERVRSVRGEVRVKVEARGFSGTVPALVAAEKPDRVYVQTVDFFGNTLAVLSSAGGALSLYDARERVLYRGASTPENLARLVPLPISPADLAQILCGSAPLLEGEPLRADGGRGFVTLEIRTEDRAQTLRVGSGAAVLRSALEGSSSAERGSYDLRFDSFDAFEGIRFPGQVSLSAEQPRVRMKLGWTDVEPNAEIDPAIFSPPVPRGARVVDLVEAAPPPTGLFQGPVREGGRRSPRRIGRPRRGRTRAQADRALDSRLRTET